MTLSRYVQLIAGSLILGSLALGAPGSPVFQSPHWLKLTAFVGFMLAQSALTSVCPMTLILRAAGVKASAIPAG